MKHSRLALLSLVGLLAPVAAHAATCPDLSGPPYYATTSVCNFIITFNADGTTQTSGPGGNYDGSDDALVGVINNSNSSISSFNLSSAATSQDDIFGFDGDGIDTFGAPSNSTDTTGYGGPNAYFTNISPDDETGTVNFINAIAAGGSDYFSLEDEIDLTAPPVVTGPPVTGGGATAPEPSSLILLGTGALGALGAMRRKLKV